MKIVPKEGMEQLLFGMKQKDVTTLYGKPDKEFNDEENNVIYVYNGPKWRLTFYEDEDLRLGYIISSNPELTLFGNKVIGIDPVVLKGTLQAHGFKKWEQEDFDLAENHFDESNWLILQSEFGLVSKVEMGATINDKDDFDWKFPTK